MPVDEAFGRRVHAVVADEPALTSRRMFGGVAFMVHGNLAVGVASTGELLVRTDPDDVEALLAHPHTRPFEMHGRGMRGWLLVDQAAVEDDDALAEWVERGLDHARSLPPKS
jgi:TfoX/Sxy family transcriptional regulator of competence genes